MNKMNKIKDGTIALGWYCLLAGLSYMLALVIPKITVSLLYIVVLVLSLLLWYEFMRIDFRKGIQQSIITMLFFIIPSLVISIGNFLQMENELWKMVYIFFHGPFIYGFAPVTDLNLPALSIILPSGVIMLLFIFLITKYIIIEKKWQKSPYLY
ncbi:MAG TPA: hypothetical protein DER33_01930 [Syntrophomonas sp.]|jgi:hypothetical protein|nr:hypothetical protein [Syntrophomonas sp.]HCF70347.1 hypothetical protein [Syntrophomonas sp.]